MSGSCSASYAAGTQVTMNAAPAAGWTLQGWSGFCSGGNPCNVTMNSNYSPRATFLQNTTNYTLTVNEAGYGTVTSADGKISCTNGSNGSSGTCSASYASGTTVTLAAAAASGWTFSSWSSISAAGCNAGNPCVVVMNSGLAPTATFTQNTITYTLTPAITGQGTITSTDGKINCTSNGSTMSGSCSASYAAGTQVTMNAAPAAG